MTSSGFSSRCQSRTSAIPTVPVAKRVHHQVVDRQGHFTLPAYKTSDKVRDGALEVGSRKMLLSLAAERFQEFHHAVLSCHSLGRFGATADVRSANDLQCD